MLGSYSSTVFPLESADFCAIHFAAQHLADGGDCRSLICKLCPEAVCIAADIPAKKEGIIQVA